MRKHNLQMTPQKYVTVYSVSIDHYTRHVFQDYILYKNM